MNTGKIERKLYGIWQVAIFFYLFFLTTTISNAGTSIFMGLTILLTLYFYIKKKWNIIIPPKGFLVPLLVFLGSLLIATVAIGDVSSFRALWKYITWTFPFLIFYYAGKAKYMDVLCEDSTLLSIGMMGMYSLWLFLTLPAGTRITGFSAQPNLYAIRVELVLTFAIMYVMGIRNVLKRGWCQKRQLIHYTGAVLVSVLGIIALFLTKSRGGCAGFLLGLVLLAAVMLAVQANTKKYIKIFVIVCIAASIGVFTFGQGSHWFRGYDSERILLWKSSYQMWKDHPWLGVGYANWTKEYKSTYISPKAKEPDLTQPHNVIISFYSRSGIIGGTGYLVFVLGETAFLIRKIKKRPDDIRYQALFWAFMTITTHGLVDAGITNKFAMQIFSAYAGITLALDQNQDREEH